MEGGCGTHEERMPEMIQTSAELMERYPGLFRTKTSGPKGVERVEGELRFRLHSLDQVARWQAAMRGEVTVTAAKRRTTAKARPAPSSPRGHCYVLVNEAKAYAPGSSQADFIIAQLRKAGGRGLNRHDVVAKAVADPKRFPTNQPHDRAVGFWLSKLKGQGALRFAE